MTNKRPLVSIIIPTRNSVSMLETCLKSIRLQAYSNVEIIIADNHSVDRTREIAKKYNAKIVTAGPPPPYNDFFTAPMQRKMGAMNASGDILFFVDSDMSLTHGLVVDCVERILEGADAVVVPEISCGEGFWSSCRVIERRCYVGDEAMDAPRFIERSAYEFVGGWQEDVGAFDDWSLAARFRSHGLKVSYSKSFILHYEGRLSLQRLFQKKYNMGKSLNVSRYIRRQKHPKMLIAQLTPLRVLTILRRAPRFTKNPNEILGAMVIRFVVMSAMAMGLISAQIRSRSY